MKKFSFLLLGLGIIGATIVRAQATSENASISLKKDLTGLFVLTAKDPEGIKEFWLAPAEKSRYGGQVNCPRTFVNNTVALNDPGDFTPALSAYIIDCQGNREDFTLAPPKDGVTFGERLISAEEKAPEATAAATPTEAPKSTTEISAGGEAAPPAITAPVPELGGCASEKECRAYCDDPAHIEACVAYGTAHHLLSPEEADRATHFLDVTKNGGGPGGCTTPDSCASYCEELDHIEACLAFAQTHNVIPPEELTQAERAAKLLREGQAFPGGCKSKTSCEDYCESLEHIDECLAFADKSGFLSPEELAQAHKFAPLMQRGETPGGCTSKKSCEDYCDDDSHLDECIAFGVKAGIVKPEEADMIKKAGGKGPGNCKSKAQCDAYCNDPAHIDECLEFGVKAGFVKPEDVEMMKKAGGSFAGGSGFSGPGGCKNREECTAYCTANREDEACKKMIRDFGGKGGVGGPGGDTGEGGQGDNGGEEYSGFTECGITDGASAAYVCGISQKGARPGLETTYFNECHAKGHDGTKILHQGVCVRGGEPDKPCSDIAHPVCGTDGGNYIAACYAKEHGAEVKHEGVCTDEDRKGYESERRSSGGPNGAAGGPGGCTSAEACSAYCAAHYTDPACGAYGGGPPPAETNSAQYQQVPAYNASQSKTPEYPQNPDESSYEVPATSTLCANFSSVPACSYVGSPDSQGYELCKKCYPDK